MSPEELLYAESHEWVSVSSEGGQKVATIGISAFAVHESELSKLMNHAAYEKQCAAEG
jgi:glycine cleavage system H lipoate-binding protein